MRLCCMWGSGIYTKYLGISKNKPYKVRGFRFCNCILRQRRNFKMVIAKKIEKEHPQKIEKKICKKSSSLTTFL